MSRVGPRLRLANEGWPTVLMARHGYACVRWQGCGGVWGVNGCMCVRERVRDRECMCVTPVPKARESVFSVCDSNRMDAEAESTHIGRSERVHTAAHKTEPMLLNMQTKATRAVPLRIHCHDSPTSTLQQHSFLFPARYMTQALRQILADQEKLTAAAKAHRSALKQFATVRTCELAKLQKQPKARRLRPTFIVTYPFTPADADRFTQPVYRHQLGCPRARGHCGRRTEEGKTHPQRDTLLPRDSN